MTCIPSIFTILSFRRLGYNSRQRCYWSSKKANKIGYKLQLPGSHPQASELRLIIECAVYHNIERRVWGRSIFAFCFKSISIPQWVWRDSDVTTETDIHMYLILLFIYNTIADFLRIRFGNDLLVGVNSIQSMAAS